MNAHSLLKGRWHSLPNSTVTYTRTPDSLLSYLDQKHNAIAYDNNYMYAVVRE